VTKLRKYDAEQVELGPGVLVEKFKADAVRIYADTPEMLDEEFMRQPADLAYWGARFKTVLQKFKLADAKAKRVRKQRYLEIREEIKETARQVAKGKITVDDLKTRVEAAVENDPAVLEAEVESITAEAEKEEMRIFLDAVKSKRDMLIQLGAQYRAELERDPALANRSRAFRQRRREEEDDDE